MSEWRETTLEELAAPERYSVVGGPFGSALGRKDYVEDGVPVIRGAQLAGPGAFTHDDLLFVTGEKADRHRGNLAFPGDIIVTQRGTIGQIGRIPEDAPYDRYLLSQSQMKLSVDRNTADSRFVYFALLSPAVQHALHGSTMSAGVPHINLGTFRQLRLIVPTPAAQRRVSEILGAIDDLIENNRRRIEVLEQMAQAIYREWFVHFRYPGHEDATFVHSPLGPIPDGWEVRRLRAMATLDRTSAQPGRFPHEEFDHFSIPAFDDGALPAVDVGDTIKSGKFLVSTSAVLVSKLNPRIERTWFAEPAADRRSVASTEFLVLRPLLGFSLEFVYLTVRSARFQDRLRALSGGTSTSHQRAKPDDFLEIDVLQPPVSAVLRFTEFSAPQLRMGRTLRVESRQLAALRDLLLPKLVTGQIDVSHLDLDALVDSTA